MSQSIAEQCTTMRRRIEALAPEARSAVALGAAQRLMNQHLKLPEEQRAPFTIAWAEALSMQWTCLACETEELKTLLNAKLREYCTGPYYHELAEDAMPGADEDAASASIYATEAYCTGNSNAAASSAMQLLADAELKADKMAEALGEDLMSKQAAARRVEFQQAEIDRLRCVVSLLEGRRLEEKTLQQVKEIFLRD